MQNKNCEQPKIEMENDTETPSVLIEGATISVNRGLLVLCKIGKLPPHPFFAFEYLTPERQKIIKCLDIRPKETKCFIGISATTKGNSSEDSTDTVMAKLETGPYWKLETCDVLQVHGFKTDNTLESGSDVDVYDISENIFSPAKNHSWLVDILRRGFSYIISFAGFSSEKTENYMTFSQAFIDHYRQNLGISDAKIDTENLEKMKNLNMEWISIESPSILVPFLTKHQFEGETQSSLVNEVKISTDFGVLVLCRTGNTPPHAFIAFEYMSKEGERTIKRLDFRPDGNKNCIIGPGKVTQADMTETDLSKLEVGPFWKLKTSKVLKIHGFRKCETPGVVRDIKKQVYSSAGDSSQPFFNFFSKKIDNCMTFSRNFIIAYKQELGIEKSDEELKNMMNLQWVPIQLPSMLVPIYKKNQVKDG